MYIQFKSHEFYFKIKTARYVCNASMYVIQAINLLYKQFKFISSFCHFFQLIDSLVAFTIFKIDFFCASASTTIPLRVDVFASSEFESKKLRRL